jgi:hypothetical protein
VRSEQSARDVLNIMTKWGFLEATKTKHKKEYTAGKDALAIDYSE